MTQGPVVKWKNTRMDVNYHMAQMIEVTCRYFDTRELFKDFIE